MDWKNVFIVGQKESLEAFRNRWFLVYAVCFAALAFFLLFIGGTRSQIAGVSAFSRTTASLINLIMLFIPLVSLVMGSIAISSERENGTLVYLLSHPVSKLEVLLGKFLGLNISIWFTILFGFGIAGIVISFRGGGSAVVYIVTIVLSTILASCFLAISLFISVLSSRTSKSLGLAIFTWLFFIVFADLGIMGSTIAFNLGIEKLFVMVSLNPVEAFKIASVINLSSRPEVLGPAGVYAIRTYGELGTFMFLVAVLIIWTIVAMVLSILEFCYRNWEER